MSNLYVSLSSLDCSLSLSLSITLSDTHTNTHNHSSIRNITLQGCFVTLCFTAIYPQALIALWPKEGGGYSLSLSLSICWFDGLHLQQHESLYLAWFNISLNDFQQGDFNGFQVSFASRSGESLNFQFYLLLKFLWNPNRKGVVWQTKCLFCVRKQWRRLLQFTTAWGEIACFVWQNSLNIRRYWIHTESNTFSHLRSLNQQIFVNFAS